MLSAFASGFLVFAFLAAALFQLAIALGAPLGEYAFGVAHSEKLPLALRIVSWFSVLAALAIAGHYLAQLGLLPKLLPTSLNILANWVLVAICGVLAVVNNFTKSPKQKRLWGGTSIAILLAAFLVAF